MTNSPNPFVDLPDMNPYASPSTELPANPYTSPAPAELPDSIGGLQRDVLEQVADYDSLLNHIMADLRIILETVGHKDPDIQVNVARVVSEAAKQAGVVKSMARDQLWDRYGSGTHATPGGLKFMLSKPAISRRTDFKLLETKYTEAYETAVNITYPGPDSKGKLTIK